MRRSAAVRTAEPVEPVDNRTSRKRPFSRSHDQRRINVVRSDEGETKRSRKSEEISGSASKKAADAQVERLPLDLLRHHYLSLGLDCCPQMRSFTAGCLPHDDSEVRREFLPLCHGQRDRDRVQGRPGPNVSGLE